MEKHKEGTGVFCLTCPHCESVLWVDDLSRDVIKVEKQGKKKASLDELLEKEEKKKSEADRKFEATAELEKRKREQARELFNKALSGVDKTED